MGNQGVKKKIDNLGRIVIPKEYRNNLKINKYDELEIFLESDHLSIRKTGQYCRICGGGTSIHKVEDSYICSNCIIKIKKC